MNPPSATSPAAAAAPPQPPVSAAAPPVTAASSDPPTGPGLTRTVAAVLAKELRVELRTLESVPGMCLLALSAFVVFHFALQANEVAGDEASGVLWVTLLFASLLGVNRLFVADAEQGGFDGFLLAPVDRSALLLAKAAALLLYLVALQVVAVPAFGLLLLEPPLGPALPGLILVLACADIGIALTGTLIAALTVRTRARDLLGPLLALPLLTPLLLAGARATAPLLAAAGHGSIAPRWIELIGLYDLVLGLIAYAVFDFLLEE